MYLKNVFRLIRALRRTQIRRMSQNNQNGSKNEREIVLPPEPTCCCMTGCPNCVWIKYAQELAYRYADGDVIAKKKISESVKDPNMKAFLLTTLGLQNTKSDS